MPKSKGAKAHFLQGYEVFEYTDAVRVKSALKLPTTKIAVSSWIKQVLSDDLGVEQIAVVLNSIDATQFYSAPRPRNVKSTVGMIHSTTTCKNSDAGLEALRLICRANPGAKLAVIAPGRARESLYCLSTVTFCRIWLKMNYGKFTPRATSGSRQAGRKVSDSPILEAMACRTPVVATRAGAAPELIIDGENGFLVDGYRPAEIGRGRNESSGHGPAEWRKMSDRAYETAHSYHVGGRHRPV